MNPLATLDTQQIKNAHPQGWHAEKLTSIAGVKLKFRVMRNTTAQFHTHNDSPECFFVISGSVIVDTDQGSVTLNPGQFFRVEPGVSHRSRVEGEATLLVLDQFPD